MKHYATPHDVTADHLHSRGVANYLDRAAQFQSEAQQKTPTDNAFTLAELREVSHLHDLEQECYSLAGKCMTYAQRATIRAYQHRQLVAVCNTKPRTPVERLTLAQVSAQHIDRDTLTSSNAPPGQLVTLSPIATCAASNAPGLDRHAHTQEVMATT